MTTATGSTERIHRRGRGVICSPLHSQWFQGYFLPDENTQLGLLGIEQHVDECVQCPDGGYQRFLVTVTNFESQREANAYVLKRGGELCRLEPEDDSSGMEQGRRTNDNNDTTTIRDGITFETHVLLTETKAVEAIRTYFPSLASRDGVTAEVRW